MNRDFVISGYLPANHFYQLLGLEPLEGGDTVGWSIDTGIYWIDFNHSKVTLDDGLEVLVIDMDWVPAILSGLGAAGVIVTSVLAVRATPKALRKIRADSKTNHDGDPEAYSKLEAVKSAWVCYIPAAISGTATIFCIFGANVLSKRQQAALTSAYALLNDSYNNYKDKLKELYGEEAHQKIVDAIAAEKAKDVYITSTGLVRNSSLDFDEHDPNDERLFYDMPAGILNKSGRSQKLQAVL